MGAVILLTKGNQLNSGISSNKTSGKKKPPDLTSKRNLALMAKIGKAGRGGEKMAAGRDLTAAAEGLLILILILI